MGCSSSLPLEDSHNKIIINVYFNGMKQPIAFHEGTPANDIEILIKKCFKLPMDLQVDFMDESGIPLVLSGYIPNDESVFMKRSDHQNTETQPLIALKKKIQSDDDSGNPTITQDMRKWDEDMNTNGIIDGIEWRTHGDWPFIAATVGGIDHTGGVYKYSIRFTGNKDDFMYVYHSFGMMFKDEMGVVKRSIPRVSFMPSFRFKQSMYRTEGLFDIIVDVREKGEVNYSAHEQGIYFILKPETRCLAFTPLFGKKPCKTNPLLFTIATKNHCKCVVEKVGILNHRKPG